MSINYSTNVEIDPRELARDCSYEELAELIGAIGRALSVKDQDERDEVAHLLQQDLGDKARHALLLALGAV